MAEPLFVLTLHTRSPSFGERSDQESDEVGRILRAADHAIRSGSPLDKPEQRMLKDRNGAAVGSFEFGAGSLRNPARPR